MRYAEALRTRGLPTQRSEAVRLVANAETGQIATFLRAHGAVAGVGYEVEETPFGGLRTGFTAAAEAGEAAVAIVAFDDVFPELGYRSAELWTQAGVGACLAEASQRIERFGGWLAAELSRWPGRAIVVPPLAAPPPVLAAAGRATELRAAALRLEAALVEGLAGLPRVAVVDAGAVAQGLDPADVQSAGPWLQAGTPLSLVASDRVAAAVHRLLCGPPAAKKVLVTDADHTLWQGVLGDDGPGRISAHADGAGWVHHVYQGTLSLLRSRGALLAICSRGELGVLNGFLADPGQRQRAGVRLPAEAFAAVRCSWRRKSGMLAEVADELGLGLESFAFVDDNRVELAEVEAELPAVTSLRFPRAAELEGFLATLSELFAADRTTTEDRRRSDLYEIRQRAERDRPRFETLDEFLGQLEMVAEFGFVESPDDARPLQLLNRTNQFNLTGERLSEEAWRGCFGEEGRRCVQGRLRDRHGDHGLVLAGLLRVGPESVAIENLAVSCRVLNRGFETAFLDWLARRFRDVVKIEARWRATGRNAVARGWLAAHGFAAGDDPERLQIAFGGDFALPDHHVALEDRAALVGGDE